MAPQQKFEIVVLKFTFSKYVDPLSPRISLQRKRYMSSGSMAHVRDWYDRTMNLEKSKIPLHLKVRYCEWNVITGNVDLFTVHGYCFEKVLLILGEDVIHCLYYKNMPMERRLEGYVPLTDNYCSCCLQNQYLKIMESVKGCIIKGGWVTLSYG